MLDLLSTCEQKLVLLIEELSSHDLDTLQKEMEDDEVGRPCLAAVDELLIVPHPSPSCVCSSVQRWRATSH